MQPTCKIYLLRQVTDLKNLKATEQVNTVSELMTSGEFVSIGLAIKPKMVTAQAGIDTKAGEKGGPAKAWRKAERAFCPFLRAVEM